MDRVNYESLPGFVPKNLDDISTDTTIQWAMDLLLHARNHVPQDALTCLEVNRIFLGNGGFVCTAFRPANQEPEFPLFEFLINLQGLVDQVYERTGVYYSFLMDGQVLVLSCFPRLTPAQQREQQLQDLTLRLAQTTCRLCQTHWQVELVPVVGPVTYGIETLSESFFFVTDLMEYKLFTGDNSQYYYEPSQLHTNELINNTASIQQKADFLANELYAGNELDTQQYAGDLVSFIIDSDVSSLRNVHICILTFVQSLSKELLRLGVVDADFLKKQDMMERLLQAPQRQNLQQALGTVLAEIQAHMLQQERNQSIQKIQAVRTCIDEGFTDPNLSLDVLAEQVGLHPSTVSSLFKKQFGITVLGYIRQCRVSYAKTLLGDAGKTLEQVAAQSGFGSLNSMYRAFKAQEGIPPGQLR